MRTHFSSILGLAAALSVTLAARAAQAGPDLTVRVAQPSNVYVYAPVRYTTTVSNIGNQTSATATLTIQLPRTHTSPTVSLLGTLGAMTPGCVRSGTTLTCPVAQIRRGSTQSFYFDLTIPQSSAPVQIATSVATGGAENSRTNNSYTHTAALLNIDHTIVGDTAAHNRHCTGQELTSFFECELYPSSIASHDVLLNFASHTLSFPSAPGYSGTWSQPNPDEFVFQYTLNGAPVADFIGYGVGGGCFEGITIFPNSAYVSPYEVCLTP